MYCMRVHEYLQHHATFTVGKHRSTKFLIFPFPEAAHSSLATFSSTGEALPRKMFRLAWNRFWFNRVLSLEEDFFANSLMVHTNVLAAWASPFNTRSVKVAPPNLVPLWEDFSFPAERRTALRNWDRNWTVISSIIKVAMCCCIIPRVNGWAPVSLKWSTCRWAKRNECAREPRSEEEAREVW